ncbi:MAG TPA: PDZ domain-containing protein [Terriglobia bacterium]|nr:PDZ domain-containing protein [Terriglobia bacterium]
MKTKTSIGMLSLLAFLLASGTLPGAQRAGAFVTPRAGTMSVWNFNEGRAQLGVRLTDVNAEKAHEMKIGGEYGAIVTKVEPGSAAAQAGLMANDVILEFDGERVRSVAQLRRMVQDTPPGRTVAVKISRSGQARTLNVKLEAAAAAQNFPKVVIPRVEVPEINMPDFNFEFFNGGPRLGISAEDLTPQLAKYFGVTQGKGVLVEEVTAGSAAEKAGLKAGDCIVRVGAERVDSVSDLHRALERNADSEQKRQVALTIVRDRHEQTLSAELESPHRMMPMLRRIANDGQMGIDPNELSRMKAGLKTAQIALQTEGKDLESQRRHLIEEKQPALDKLRRDFEKVFMESNSLVVD